VPLCHAIRAHQFIDVVQLWLINLLLDDTQYLAVDQTDFREVRFGQVKRALPARKAESCTVTHAQCAGGAAVSM